MLAVSQKIFYINSRSRMSGSSSDFTYELKIPPGNRYSHACALHVSIPRSFYLVTPPNNTFTLVEGKTSTIITLPTGNYNVKNLIAVTSQLLSSSSQVGASYQLSYPSSSEVDTGLLTISGINVNAITELIFPNSPLADIFGFERASTNIFTIDGINGTLISTQIIDMQRETTLYIHSNLVSSDTDDILQEVFASSVPDYGRIVWQCTSEELSSKTLAAASTQSSIFRFTLTDEDGFPIDLNGQDMQITLCVYQKSVISDIIPKAIKINTLESLQSGQKAPISYMPAAARPKKSELKAK